MCGKVVMCGNVWQCALCGNVAMCGNVSRWQCVAMRGNVSRWQRVAMCGRTVRELAPKGTRPRVSSADPATTDAPPWSTISAAAFWSAARRLESRRAGPGGTRAGGATQSMSGASAGGGGSGAQSANPNPLVSETNSEQRHGFKWRFSE